MPLVRVAFDFDPGLERYVWKESATSLCSKI